MPTPVSWTTNPPPEDGNPRLLAAWAFENAWLVANEKASASDAWFDKAITAEGGPPTMAPTPFAFAPNAPPPSVFIPYMAEGASVARFYEMSTAVINQLAGLYDGYMTQYFPNECGYLEKAQEWICNTLTNGGTGMNAAVEAQIFERGRARVLREGRRAEKDIIALWAARNYALPPGAAAGQVLQLRLDTTGKVAELSRDVVIKQMEIEIENVRFAVENAVKLYNTATSAAGEYLKALAVGPTSAMQVIPSVTDSQAKLIGAATDYWRANISVEELRLKASMPAAEWEQQSRIKNADWVMDMVKTQVAAAVAAAQSVGTQAAAALNSLHASVGVSNGTQDSVSFNYSNDTVDAAPTIITMV